MIMSFRPIPANVGSRTGIHLILSPPTAERWGTSLLHSLIPIFDSVIPASYFVIPALVPSGVEGKADIHLNVHKMNPPYRWGTPSENSVRGRRLVCPSFYTAVNVNL